MSPAFTFGILMPAGRIPPVEYDGEEEVVTADLIVDVTGAPDVDVEKGIGDQTTVPPLVTGCPPTDTGTIPGGKPRQRGTNW
jgi:hypothetical protein